MKKHLTKQTIIRLAVIVLFLAVYAAVLAVANSGWNGYTITDATGIEYETAKVLEVLEDRAVADDAIEGFRRGDMELKLEITTGRYAGAVVEVTDYLSAMYNVDVGAGDTVSVRIDTTDVGVYQVSIYNYNRTPWLLLFLGVFAAALVAIGGWQGLRAFTGLVFTFVSIVFLLVPLTLRGYPSVPLTIALVAVTTAVSFYLLGGWQPKTVGGTLGCICGVCCAALLGAAAIGLVHISAYQMDEAEALILVQNEHGLQMRGLFLSGILLASLGAVMDIAMSVASAMDELKLKRPDITRSELFRSGMKVGRDASGTMANTLVLANAGASLNMMVLIYSYQVSFTQLMNTDFIAVELIRGIAGSLGILAAVPCVAAITSVLLTRRNGEQGSDARPAPEPGKEKKAKRRK